MTGRRLEAVQVELPPARAGDVRLGDLLGESGLDGARCVLIGFPCDEGVRRDGGRVGAAQGARALREALYRLPPMPAIRTAMRSCCVRRVISATCRSAAISSKTKSE